MNPFSNTRKEESSELPLAPFLDIIFILLIFVLVSTSMVTEYVLPVDLPDSSSTGVSSTDLTLDIYLKESSVQIPDLEIETEISMLRESLKEQCEANPIFKVRASADLPLQSFVSLTDELQGCGSMQRVVERRR